MPAIFIMSELALKYRPSKIKNKKERKLGNCKKWVRPDTRKSEEIYKKADV